MSPRKVPVTLKYASSGIQPPVFTAGSFSEPAWHPHEMEYTTNDDGEHEFRKEVMVDEGSQHQYKFRIGTGDWWALNEQAPTATDELGNRNNLLTAPPHIPEESFSESSHSDFIPTPPESQPSIPDVVVEKVDDEPRHGDDFGEASTVAQKVAHEKRAADAEPDRVIIRSQTSTPVFASTAAEVADSAAFLDREASPAPITDEEAGRTGERRLSSTPIPQVASIAAEVADSAAIIDRDDMKIQLPIFEYNPESYSSQATPGHERAPLFAHECLSPSHEHEDQIGGDEFKPDDEKPRPDSLSNPLEHGGKIDVNDPSLEEFPQDRKSILAHVISTESRLNEDETHFEGVPPSPVATPKSRTTSFDNPSYIRLDAQPSPLLGVITEENQDGDVDSLKLPSPSPGFASLNDSEAVPEIEDVKDLNEQSKSIDPINAGDSIAPSKSEKLEVAKDSEPSADAGKLFPAQEAEAAKDLKIYDNPREAEKAPIMREPKDSDQATEEHIPVGQLPVHVDELSNWVGDEPTIAEKAPTHLEETETINESQESSSVGKNPPIDDRETSKADVSLEDLADVKCPGKEDSTSQDATHSSDLRGLSAAVGATAVGGAIIGGLLTKDSSRDTTGQISNIHKSPTAQKTLDEPKKLDIDNQSPPATADRMRAVLVPIETADEPKSPLPTAGVDKKVPVKDLTPDAAAPHIPVQVASVDKNGAVELDAPLPEGLDTAKSSSLEDPTSNGNIESHLKIRRVVSTERSPTPSSIHSAFKNSESRNFFLSIWRTVFVGWIGGLLARLWGRASGS